MADILHKPYDGLTINQRNNADCPRIFVSAIPAIEINEWVDVIPTREKKGAVQRMLSDAHVRSIKNYINASEKNIIPTAITIAIPDGCYELEEVTGEIANLAKLIVKVENNNKPGLLIDGQHRLAGLLATDGSIPLLCTIILGADDLERALNFVVINNKAKRVPNDLVKAIVSELEPGQKVEFTNRITAIGLALGDYHNAVKILFLSEASPFFGIVDWDINREVEKRIIKPLALEQALRFVRNELIVESELDIDEVIEILSAMWSGIMKCSGYSEILLKPDSQLLSKAAFVATTEFLVSRLNQEIEEGSVNATDLSTVEDYCHGVIDKIPADFWIAEWKEKSLDTSAGRNLIKAALSQIRTNVGRKVDPFTKVKLLQGDKDEEYES
jgi:DGQHR domain-containing protein